MTIKDVAAGATVRRILVGLDFQEESDRAVDAAFSAAADGPPTEVHGVFVHQPAVDPAAVYSGSLAWTPDLDHKRILDFLERHHEILVKNGRAANICAVVTHAALGEPAHEIVNVAKEIRADLIVVGTHGRKGIRRAVLGSVAEHVVRFAKSPVLVVRPTDYESDESTVRIEPPCDDCLAIRAKTNGENYWCERHSQHHPRAHGYVYNEPSTEPGRPWGFRG